MISLNRIKYFVFILVCEMLTNTAFAISELPPNSLSYPVLVLLEDNSSASGFYINEDNTKLYFVTARHVIFDKPKPPKSQFTLKCKTLTLSSWSQSSVNPKKTVLKLNLEDLLKDNFIRYHQTHDVAIIYICSIINKNGNATFFFSPNYVQLLSNESPDIVLSNTLDIKKFSEVPIGNEVFIFGYPNSLGFINDQQIDYDKPLLRKGIVAGKNSNHKTIVLDCPAYQGNSGGPVLVVEKLDARTVTFLPIGIVTHFVPFVEEWVNNRYENLINTTISNSGYSIVEPMDAILELLFK